MRVESICNMAKNNVNLRDETQSQTDKFSSFKVKINLRYLEGFNLQSAVHAPRLGYTGCCI